MAKTEGAPEPDDLPSAENARALERAEKKETEDLLSGFDRPQRPRRTTPREADFVAYHDRGNSEPVSARIVLRRQPSFVVPKNDRPLKWIALGAAVLSVVVGVAWFATPARTVATPERSEPTPTIDAPVVVAADPPPSPTVAVTPAAVVPATPAHHLPRKESKSTTSSTSATKPSSVRSDFMRDL